MKVQNDSWSARCRDWLLNAHLPLWADKGIDWNGWGGHERLDAITLAPADPGQRRSMVCARQVYLWSAAHRMFKKAEHLALAERAYTALARYFRDKARGGWIFSVTKDGHPLEERKDFYAHAFVLFALAHYAAIGQNAAEALALARETWALMQEKLALPQGWFAPAATPDWRFETQALIQNPHMHLLEALLALAEGDPERGYQARIRTLIELFRTRLYCGVLGEFFDSNGVANGPEGQILEPGHHFEWAWLLRSAAQILADASLIPLADALTDWAGSTGTDPIRGGAYDQIGRDGALLRASKRLWPQSEAVKAYAAAYAATPSDATLAPLLRRLAFLFDHYLLPDGRWHEHLDADLTPMAPYLPASTPYHIFFALSEAIQALEGPSHPVTPPPPSRGHPQMAKPTKGKTSALRSIPVESGNMAPFTQQESIGGQLQGAAIDIRTIFRQ